MKYILLIYAPEEQMRQSDGGNIEGHARVAAEATVRGAYVGCDALQPPAVATTVRVRGGETVVSDGPVAETKEVLGGYYILDCGDLDEAIGYAAELPPATRGSIEIRPIAEIPGWDELVRNAVSKLRAATA